MVPEPTEAMVEAGAKALGPYADENRDHSASEAAIKAAFAAAPPEWLTDALLAKLAGQKAPSVVALTEEELQVLRANRRARACLVRAGTDRLRGGAQ